MIYLNSNFKKMWDNLSVDEINNELIYCQSLIDVDSEVEEKYSTECFDTKSCNLNFISKLKIKYMYLWNTAVQITHDKDENLNFCSDFLKKIIKLKEENVPANEALNMLKENLND